MVKYSLCDTKILKIAIIYQEFHIFGDTPVKWTLWLNTTFSTLCKSWSLTRTSPSGNHRLHWLLHWPHWGLFLQPWRERLQPAGWSGPASPPRGGLFWSQQGTASNHPVWQHTWKFIINCPCKLFHLSGLLISSHSPHCWHTFWVYPPERSSQVLASLLRRLLGAEENSSWLDVLTHIMYCNQTHILPQQSDVK